MEGYPEENLSGIERILLETVRGFPECMVPAHTLRNVEILICDCCKIQAVGEACRS